MGARRQNISGPGDFYAFIGVSFLQADTLLPSDVLGSRLRSVHLVINFPIKVKLFQ